MTKNFVSTPTRGISSSSKLLLILALTAINLSLINASKPQVSKPSTKKVTDFKLASVATVAAPTSFNVAIPKLQGLLKLEKIRIKKMISRAEHAKTLRLKKEHLKEKGTHLPKKNIAKIVHKSKPIVYKKK